MGKNCTSNSKVAIHQSSYLYYIYRVRQHNVLRHFLSLIYPNLLGLEDALWCQMKAKTVYFEILISHDNIFFCAAKGCVDIRNAYVSRTLLTSGCTTFSFLYLFS